VGGITGPGLRTPSFEGVRLGAAPLEGLESFLRRAPSWTRASCCLFVEGLRRAKSEFIGLLGGELGDEVAVRALSGGREDLVSLEVKGGAQI